MVNDKTNKQTSPKSALAAAITLALLPLNQPAAEGFQIEEVIVTATKRAEGLQDVPIALSVMGGEKITEQGVGSLEDISAFMPNVNISENSGSDAIFIRGIGSPSNAGFEQSVGTFIDGVYFGRSQASRSALLDVERVEVLKGPQSTLFGKNTVAGAMNITTAGPEEEFEASIQASLEPEFGGWGTSLIVSGALSETVNARLALRREESDGYFRNHSLNQDERQEEDTIARLTLDWQPTEDLGFRLKVEQGKTDTRGRQNTIGITTPASDFIYQTFGDPDFRAGINYDKYGTGSLPGRPAQFDDSEWDTFSLTANWDISDFNIRSITAYVEASVENSLDLDFGPLQMIGAQRFEEHDQFSQEFILTSPTGGTLEYMAGVYYQNENLSRGRDLDIVLSSIAPLFAGHPLEAIVQAGFGDAVMAGNFTQDSETFSAFSQITWNLTNDLRVIAGLRYSDDEKIFEKTMHTAAFSGTDYVAFATAASLPHQAFYDQFLNFAVAHTFDASGYEVCRTSFPSLPVPVPAVSCSVQQGYDNVRHEEHWTGDIVFQYDINADIMAYLKFGSGYKAGGFDEANLTALAEFQEFEDETVESIELGAKMSLWDGRAQLNIAVFSNSFEDVQVSVFDGVAGFVVRNAAETVTEGVELDGQVLLTENLSMRYALSYLDATYDSYQGAPCTAGQTANWTGPDGCEQDLSGQPTQFAPEWSGNLAFEYRHQLSDRLELKAGIDLQYMGDYLPTNDNDPVLQQDAFTKINARIQIAGDDSWTLALLGKNLTDETVSNAPDDIPLGNLGFLGSYFHFLDAPRSYEVQASYRF
ncbi:TonB-dependent receptor [Pseudomaricurvus alkylphenolicus]|uniref:TonB-dependent receptor n=1 Tax=Pseudomaricurvus alkylphenolicus TaxID=1306991 RepID=UPI0014215F44|nr:TonB-dependent receptor [Pseudomaricurvus alkylphenolicus]NIB42296.1 TonB-dependent receptor [Pseudomaricurvus alkylphenolicus]